MNRSNSFAAWKTAHPLQWKSAAAALILLTIAGLGLVIWLFSLALPPALLAGFPSFMTWLLAPSSTSLTWVVTRAAGLIAYLLLWIFVPLE